MQILKIFHDSRKTKRDPRTYGLKKKSYFAIASQAEANEAIRESLNWGWKLPWCRDSNVLPKFTKLSHHTNTRRTKTILTRASQAILRETIHNTRKNIASLESNLLKLHLQLSNTIIPVLWDIANNLAFWRSETDKQLKSQKLEHKYQALLRKDNDQMMTRGLNVEKTVHNISRYNMSQSEIAVLHKGFNFAVAPKTIPKEEIISEIETVIDHLESSTAEEVRQDVACILRKAKTPASNITKEEERALICLRKNKEIMILPADKWNATVVMNTEDYKRKVQQILEDDCYKKVSRDPTTYLKKTTKAKIKEVIQDEQLQKKLIPREKSSRCPKHYGLPKIHKNDVPLRPILTYQPIVEAKASYVKNSEHFLQLIKEINIDQQDVLASFDVKSLYPSIPIDEALDLIAMNEDIPSHVIQLAEHCLKTTYFRYDGQLYRQTDGAPMGSSLSPAIGNLFMTYFEAQAIRESQLKPKLWIRYVDNIFIIWSHGEVKLDHFLTYLNSLHDRIEFTIEKEKDKQLPFLDVLLTRSDGRKLQHQLYRKPTHTDKYLNAQSHHHPSQIQAVANTLICRSVRLTDEIHNKQEMEKITRTLRDNNYTESTIRNAKRTNTRTRRDSTKEQEREDIQTTQNSGSTNRKSKGPFSPRKSRSLSNPV
ncbi:uncharacterized protein LOC132697146 [Cylas formicarius]|uniref:uncharacterized protein LOC132697146 n=1 Tax=Cylas formicarius TaxID=197179 RepID=UPI0029584D1A|nr:uncharacterized protein LOC132697146 [Cylas formicarius]